MSKKQKTTNSSLKAKKEAKKKFRIKLLAAAAGVLLLSYGLYALFSPYKGGIAFGVCKVFLETHVRYPSTLNLSSVEYLNGGASIRIWYTQIDSFGEYRFEPVQCYFRATKNTDVQKYGTVPFVIEKITLNKQEVERSEVEGINKAILSIVANPPNLTIPYPLPNSLEKLQVQRRPLFQ